MAQDLTPYVLRAVGGDSLSDQVWQCEGLRKSLKSRGDDGVEAVVRNEGLDGRRSEIQDSVSDASNDVMAG